MLMVTSSALRAGPKFIRWTVLDPLIVLSQKDRLFSVPMILSKLQFSLVRRMMEFRLSDVILEAPMIEDFGPNLMTFSVKSDCRKQGLVLNAKIADLCSHNQLPSCRETLIRLTYHPESGGCGVRWTVRNVDGVIDNTGLKASLDEPGTLVLWMHVMIYGFNDDTQYLPAGSWIVPSRLRLPAHPVRALGDPPPTIDLPPATSTLPFRSTSHRSLGFGRVCIERSGRCGHSHPLLQFSEQEYEHRLRDQHCGKRSRQQRLLPRLTNFACPLCPRQLSKVQVGIQICHTEAKVRLVDGNQWLK